MRPRNTCNVLVVGAGPAGTSAAIALARLGREVLVVDRSAFPRSKACGDGLMPGAMQELARLGVDTSRLGGRTINGVTMTMQGQGSRDFGFAEVATPGLAVPRRLLDDALLRKAITDGAAFRSGLTARSVLWNGGRVTGVRCEGLDGASIDICAEWIVAADGSGTRLGRSAGLRRPDLRHRGVAARAYFAGLQDLDGSFHLVLPVATDPTGRPLTTGYGWVFPLANGMANIGVGLMPGFEPGRGMGLKTIFASFVERLHALGKPFAAMIQESPMQGASLDCGFDPPASCLDGLLLAGDAAGLVDPFTGEGIQWALESGALCAEVIDGDRRSRACVVRGYRDALAGRYRERHRLGRRLLDNRRFAWRVLVETFGSDAPLCSQLRRAMVDFGTRSAGYRDGSTPAGQAVVCDVALRDFSQRVRARIDALIGRAFPLLPRVVADWLHEPACVDRVAAYWGVARTGSAQLDLHVCGAACVELVGLGYRVLASIRRGPPDTLPDLDHGQGCPAIESPRPSSHWPNAFALLVADLLLAKAYSAAAALGTGVCERLSAAGMRLCAEGAHRAECAWEQDPAAGGDVEQGAEDGAATLFELACGVAREIMTSRGRVSPGPEQDPSGSIAGPPRRHCG